VELEAVELEAVVLVPVAVELWELLVRVLLEV
jgi:hypothetical protein